MMENDILKNEEENIKFFEPQEYLDKDLGRSVYENKIYNLSSSLPISVREIINNQILEIEEINIHSEDKLKTIARVKKKLYLFFLISFIKRVLLLRNFLLKF